MDTLRMALDRFSMVHKTFGLQGGFAPGHDMGKHWPVGLTHCLETDFFFERYQPVKVKIETGYTPIRFFAIDELRQAQNGYRWIGREPEKNENPLWPSAHLVFMDESGGGKPIIAATDSVGCPVLVRYDGRKTVCVADTLADFFNALCGLIETVYGDFNIFDIGDDDGLDERFVAVLRGRVAPVIGTENFDHLFDYLYG